VEDFGALVGFLQIYPFQDRRKFHSYIVSTIEQGKELGINRLKALVQSIALRRTKISVLGELNLRARVEKTHSVELNEEERADYGIVKRMRPLASDASGHIRGIFQTILKLRQICNHGRALLSPETRELLEDGLMNEDTVRASLALQSCENCGQEIRDLASGTISETLPPCLHFLCNNCCINSNEGGSAGEMTCPICLGIGLTAEEGLVPMSGHGIDIEDQYRPSSKVLALLENLRADRLESVGEPIKR
jgi:SNF2 family DNA or RNA helicase